MALSGKALAEFALTKLGTPYVYGAKGTVLKQAELDRLAKAYPDIYTTTYYRKASKYVGKVCVDCSGLISWYSGNEKGSYQLYSMAEKRMPYSDLVKAPVGAILWRKGHVGVYIGNNEVVEARGIDYGTIKSQASKTSQWTHILLLPGYTYSEANPYKEPNKILKRGSTGNGVKWLQWELISTGMKSVTFTDANKKKITKTLTVDGDFGIVTETAVKLYQRSCKIEVDGIVGAETRKYLKLDD